MMNRSSMLALALALVAAASGCSKRVDLEKVPVGTAVEVTRQDGGVVTGALTARDDTTVKIDTGTASRSVPRDQIVSVQLVNQTPSVLPAAAKFREFTIPAGTMIALRMNSSAGSESSRVDDPVEATLTHAVLVDGTNVLPEGSVLTGSVVGVDSAGKVKGRGYLAIRFRSVAITGSHETYPIAAGVEMTAPGGAKKDAATIAIPAAGGAILGALIGGKKGAGVGAAIGGGGGTAVVLATRGPQVQLARGAVLSVALDQAVDIRVPIIKG